MHEIKEYCLFVGLFCKYVYKYRPLYYSVHMKVSVKDYGTK